MQYSFCKRWHPPECLFYKNKNGCRFGEKCSFAHRQVDTQPTKWSKSNNDKSAVALLKKGDWHERESVTSRYHDSSGRPDCNRGKKSWSLLEAGEAINDFWSMSGSFVYRHHVEPRVKLYSPREESFPIPLKYIDVTRTTHTNLDVKLEKRIDDYWNIDGSRDLSDPWTGFTQFTLLDEKAPDGYTWSGRRLTRKQLTSRPDHLWPEL